MVHPDAFTRVESTEQDDTFRRYLLDLGGAEEIVVTDPGEFTIRDEPFEVLRDRDEFVPIESLLGREDRAVVFLSEYRFGVVAHVLRLRPDGSLADGDWENHPDELIAVETLAAAHGTSIAEVLGALGRAAEMFEGSRTGAPVDDVIAAEPLGYEALIAVRGDRYDVPDYQPPTLEQEWHAADPAVRMMDVGETPTDVLQARQEVEVLVRIEPTSDQVYGVYFLRDEVGVLDGWLTAVGTHRATMWLDPALPIQLVAASSYDAYPSDAVLITELWLPDDADGSVPRFFEIIVQPSTTDADAAFGRVFPDMEALLEARQDAVESAGVGN